MLTKRLNSRLFSSITDLGIKVSSSQKINYNLSYPTISGHYRNNKEGVLLETPYGKVNNIDTGKYTGRSPKDKWLVATPETAKNIWWGDINQQMDETVFNELYDKCIGHFNNLEQYYVYEGHCGSNPTSQKNVRFLTEYVWQHHFVKNMFIELDVDLDEKSNSNYNDFNADFTIINACNVVNDNWEKHGLNSEVFIAFNMDTNIGIIGGTHYGGCMKKGIFSLMNYHLPLNGIMTMHCSANVGAKGDTALFFGLSGTGKTTLSADPNRQLIGDDEHGWDDRGIFNFEGGCYAKTVGLSEENEPDIFKAIKPNALLENIWYDDNLIIDYDNTTKTQNGRVSYPLSHIENTKQNSMGGHPQHIIFLTCDAFGVLPPISLLTNGQAMYHFLSGYTAKVAGTERGVNEPQATFSACFGAAFLPLHPSKYADLLLKKIEKHGSCVWLVNTGWTGGKYGIGKRMSINTTRNCINAILDNKLVNTEYHSDPNFGFKIPNIVPDVDPNLLDPINTWSDKDAYQQQRNSLINLFNHNYLQYKGNDVTDYTEFGPKLITCNL